MIDHFLTRAKAYAVLAGLIVTLMLGEIDVNSRAHQVLVAIGGLATILATYKIPNKDPHGRHQDESVMPPEAGEAVLLYVLAVFVFVLLILFLVGALHR